MTRVQKVFCVFLLPVFSGGSGSNARAFFPVENHRKRVQAVPLYYFIEEKHRKPGWRRTSRPWRRLPGRMEKYLGQQMQSKNKTEEDNIEEKKEEELKTNLKTDTNSKALTETETTAAAQQAAVLPHPLLDLSPDRLADYDFLLNNFYIVDENTDASAANLNAAQFLAEDFSLSHGPLEPQILIYHSHSQETFADSGKGGKRHHCWRGRLSYQPSHRKIRLPGHAHKRSF